MKLGRDLTHVIHRDPRSGHGRILHESSRNALDPLHGRGRWPGLRDKLHPDQQLVDPPLWAHDEEALLMAGID